jgi:hypothetical protein
MNDFNIVDELNSRRYDVTIYEDPIASPSRPTSLAGHSTGRLGKTLNTVYPHYNQEIRTSRENNLFLIVPFRWRVHLCNLRSRDSSPPKYDAAGQPSSSRGHFSTRDGVACLSPISSSCPSE